MKNYYEVRGDAAVITIHRRDGSPLEALIDLDDLPRAQEIPGTWGPEGKANTTYVAAHWRDGDKETTLKLHRYLTGAPAGMDVDHINHNGLNNRRSCNLRVVSKSANSFNRRGAPRHSRTGVRGVYWRRDVEKFGAEVTVGGQTRYLGLYPTIEEAGQVVAAARQAAEADLYAVPLGA